jgi:hypothetical protein
LLQRALQMQQKGTRAEAAGEVRPPAKNLQMQAEQGLGRSGRERTRRKAVWLQIRCKCSQTAPATVQLRDGNTPNSAMHCVKGKPVALKIGFAVGSAKLVVPLPPNVVPSNENSA